VNRASAGCHDAEAFAEKGAVPVDARQREASRSWRLVLQLGLPHPLHQGSSSRRGKKEWILGSLPASGDTHLLSHALHGAGCGGGACVDPCGGTEQHDFPHLELNLTDAGRRIPLSAKTAPACGEH
jgi:hypothetical protein